MSGLTDTAFVRDGMLYETSADGKLHFYSPCTEFFVDGIRYVISDGGDDVQIRPIVSVIDDHPTTCRCHGGRYPMRLSRPPTEAELDRWVTTGNPL